MIYKKDAYLCNPNGNEGETKDRNGGCRKEKQKRLKQAETWQDEQDLA
ncbi:hypothetical protein [Pedobacter terrae]